MWTTRKTCGDFRRENHAPEAERLPIRASQEANDARNSVRLS
jgi:hypothetical protein